MPSFEELTAEFSQPEAALVTPQRIFEQLAADVFSPVYSPALPDQVTATHNDLDWFFTPTNGIVKVECALPTTLSAELSGDVLRALANEVNASAFDGRALVGTTGKTLELRGDASFVTTAGLDDDQLFVALNYAVVAAQDALLNLLDKFNEVATSVETE